MKGLRKHLRNKSGEFDKNGSLIFLILPYKLMTTNLMLTQNLF